MVSSYIFYHYQLQEEKQCSGDKYSSIYLLGNLLAMYHEFPIEEEKEKYNGKLKTNNTPINWHEIMSQHFLSWDDFDGEWREVKRIQ